MAQTLNVKCVICDEFYKPDEHISVSARCGHAFHRQCLMRWLQTRNSCPQCRAHCSRLNVLRLFLNYGEPIDESDLPPIGENKTKYWLIMDLSEWSESDNVPEGAIKVGQDKDGNETYVARVYFADDLLPAAYVPAKKAVYTSYSCTDHLCTENIELLVLAGAECDWLPAQNGQVPQHALKTGETIDGEPLYTGRAVHKGVTLLGKVHPSHGVLYMPYKGQEINTKKYQVLVEKPKAEEGQ